MSAEAPKRPEENTPEDPSIALSHVLEECAKAPGFVMFAAIMTKKIDDAGNFIIELRYQRHKFPFEDAKEIIKVYKQHLKEDFASAVDEADRG